MIKVTKKSLDIVQCISDAMESKTFHHHFHILYDIPIENNGYYVEIGCYAGASACLMLQKEKINVISIDLGYPISEDVVKRNVKKFNVNNNNYHYLKGNSQSSDMVNRLKQITQIIDLLYIDGDHSYQGVKNDFVLYESLVKPGGFIVFDDYNDIIYSADVKIAVDDIVSNLTNTYEIIGTIPNNFGARPKDLQDGNCFVLRKL